MTCVSHIYKDLILSLARFPLRWKEAFLLHVSYWDKVPVIPLFKLFNSGKEQPKIY